MYYFVQPVEICPKRWYNNIYHFIDSELFLLLLQHLTLFTFSIIIIIIIIIVIIINNFFFVGIIQHFNILEIVFRPKKLNKANYKPSKMKVLKDTFQRSFKLHIYWCELEKESAQTHTYLHVHINAHALSVYAHVSTQTQTQTHTHTHTHAHTHTHRVNHIIIYIQRYPYTHIRLTKI